MAAGLVASLAEVGAEIGGLAAVVAGELQHLAEAGGLPPLALEGALMQALGQGVEVAQQAPGLAALLELPLLLEP